MTHNPTSKREQWQQHIAHWKSSGQSQKSYCVEHDLNFHTFAYWRQRLNASSKKSANHEGNRSPKASHSFRACSYRTARIAPTPRVHRGTSQRYTHSRCFDGAPRHHSSALMKSLMRPCQTLTCIYLYRDPVDFRKASRGLAMIIEQELGHNPFSGTLYAFTNRQRNKIKCLFWDHNGFVLYDKALAEEKFHWPKQGEKILTLNGEQINGLLDGYNITLMRPHKNLKYEHV